MQISIPGSQNSGIDTAKLIEDLLDAERIPVTRIEERITESEKKIGVWRNTDTNMTFLQDNSRKLYSFNNPFSERYAESSDERIVEVQATRNTGIGDYRLYVKKIATSDRWLSQTIESDYKPPKGIYTFIVGTKEISFSFQDNSISELIDAINSKGKDFVQLSTIKKGVDTKDTVLLLEGLIKGVSGKLVLKDAAEQFANEVKLIGKKDTSLQIPIALHTRNINSYISEKELFIDSPTAPLAESRANTARSSTSSGTNATNAGTRSADTFLTLTPGAVAKFLVSNSNISQALNNPNSTLIIEVIAKPTNTQTATSQDETRLLAEVEDNIVLSPQIKQFGNAFGSDDAPIGESQNTETASIENTGDVSASTTDDASSNPPADPSTRNTIAPSVTTRNSIFTMLFDTKLQSKFEISRNDVSIDKTISIAVPVSDIKTTGSELQFILANPFLSYTLTVNNAFLSDSETSTSVQPLQAIDNAQNALVEFNGIDIERDSNAVTDIIPGVSLSLKRADENNPVTISVNSNKEAIKDDIINFVGAYNQVIKNLLVYTSRNVKLLEQIQFPTEQDKVAAADTLGIFSNEFSLTRMLNTLQTIVSSQYNNPIDPKISSLREIGIAANLAQNTQKTNTTTNKLLDIDETILDDMIAKNPDAIAKLFGADINNDVEIDYGVAFKIVDLLTPYTRVSGTISQRQDALESKSVRDKKELDKYEKHMVTYEKEIRRKYGNMEQSLNRLNQSTRALDSLSNNNNQQ